MNINVLKQLGVKVKSQRGDEVLALCPFHDDRNPSFSINLKKEVFYCFACGAKGNFRQFGLEKKKTIVHWDSWDDLLSEDTKPEEVMGVPEGYEGFDVGETYYNRIFWDYVKGRRLSFTTLRRFKVGYCLRGHYRDRIIIPLPIGFVARTVYEDSMGQLIFGDYFQRYLYPLGLPKRDILFNLDRNNKLLILVEGAFDVLTMDTYGYSATAILGSNLSQGQLKAICESEIEHIALCFDGDEAGRIGMEKAGDLLTPYFSSISVVKLPKGKDPASCVKSVIRQCFREVEIFTKNLQDTFPAVERLDSLE